MYRLLLLLVALLLSSSSASALISAPAKWHHGLSSTYLAEYKKGEHLILSDMWTGTLGRDAVVQHSVSVKVEGFEKPSTATVNSPDGTTKEVLQVILHEGATPQEMRADFDHTVYVNGKVKLRFAGVTVLSRVNAGK